MTRDDPHIEMTVTGDAPRAEAAPIFILGIMPRSGTNFLHRLLCRHPDCGAVNTTPVREDYLIHHAGWLARYVGRLKWQWGHWGADAGFVKPLAHGIGKGVTGFLSTLTEAHRIVTKTPSVSNLPYFFDFFPHAHLLIVVRDGRSLVASGMSGFGWNFETASRAWARAARKILAFQDKNEAFSDRYRIVLYERLNEGTTEELETVLRFIGLEPSRYDFDAAREMPVFGSSFMKGEGEDVSWQPRAKAADFEGNARWKSWSRFRHRRFNWIAGREMKAFGYELEFDTGSAILHRLLDARYRLRCLPRQFAAALKQGIRAFLDALQDEEGKTNLKR